MQIGTLNQFIETKTKEQNYKKYGKIIKLFFRSYTKIIVLKLDFLALQFFRHKKKY